jgi:hypothetical protein
LLDDGLLRERNFIGDLDHAVKARVGGGLLEHPIREDHELRITPQSHEGSPVAFDRSSNQ